MIHVLTIIVPSLKKPGRRWCYKILEQRGILHHHLLAIGCNFRALLFSSQTFLWLAPQDHPKRLFSLHIPRVIHCQVFNLRGIHKKLLTSPFCHYFIGLWNLHNSALGWWFWWFFDFDHQIQTLMNWLKCNSRIPSSNSMMGSYGGFPAWKKHDT